MDTEKNYGLSEGVFKACQFLGLEFSPTVPEKLDPYKERVPSDYFGNDFELDSATVEKLCVERKWTEKQFNKEYKDFTKKFSSQKPLKQTKTDVNVFFCDHVLHSVKFGNSVGDYFDFEFYGKSFELRQTFLLRKHARSRIVLCNEYSDLINTTQKSRACEIFFDFLHRDWLDTEKCTYEEFKIFVEKHPNFFSKPIYGMQGKDARVIKTNFNQNLKLLFDTLKEKKMLLEEIIVQHKSLSAFCSDTVNTIRVNTFLDIHGAVHILTTSGRFGRMGNVVDNFHGGGFSVVIDPETGIIISDGMNRVHERAQKHPDTGKTFKGFQYPSWEKIRSAVTKMAKLIPRLRHIGWDIAINYKGEPVFVEANNASATDIQQAPDSIGRLHLYQPLLDQLKNYKTENMRRMGWRVNNLRKFESSYEKTPARHNSRLQLAMSKLIPDCESLMDVGCRKGKFVKSLTPPPIRYYPVDYRAYDDEIIACDFNRDFPDIKVDTCLCAFTAEYVEHLPQFLANMCNAAQKQILMWCRPIDKEIYSEYRYYNPFLTDFTEEFLIQTMEQNNFRLDDQYPTDNPSVILYDFRKIIE